MNCRKGFKFLINALTILVIYFATLWFKTTISAEILWCRSTKTSVSRSISQKFCLEKGCA